MVLTEKQNKRVDSGMDAQAFQIQASSKAFEILSSGLYNNRERAVLRELMCNAYDAHVDANKKTVPFEVYLPTTIEPTLTIKDYGTGLSEEQVYELYTTYFSSNKTDSNMFVGALGLGSKSPFSVADQFTVKSRYNGTESSYLCFISEDGIPQVSKVFEKETEETNGMTIQVSINEDYISKFRKEYIEVVKPFAIKPQVKGVKDDEIELYKNMTSTLEGQGWKWVEKGNFSREDLSVIQGNVEYPLVIQNLNISGELKSFHEDILRRYQDKILIYFPLGTLNVAANREELSLDDKTIKNIEKRLDIVRDEIRENAISKVNSIESDIELNEYFNNFGHSMQRQLDDILWNGAKISDVLSGKRIDPANHGKIIKYSVCNRGVRREISDYRMPVSSGLRVFYYDYDRGKHKGTQKIRDAIKERKFKQAVLVYDLRIIQEQYYGVVPYTNLSEFEGPTSLHSSSSSANTERVPEIKVFQQFSYRMNGRDYYNSDFYNMLDHSNKKALCIVSGGNKRVLINGKTISEEGIQEIIFKMFRKYDKFFKRRFIPIIYKVSKPESRTDEFNTHPDIVKFDEVFEYMLHKETKNSIKPFVYSQIISRLNGTNFADLTNFHGNRTGIKVENIENKNSPIVKLINIYNDIESKNSSHSNKKMIWKERLIKTGRELGYEQARKFDRTKRMVKTDYLIGIISSIYKRYPLLNHIRPYTYGMGDREKMLKELENYVNLIDKN